MPFVKQFLDTPLILDGPCSYSDLRFLKKKEKKKGLLQSGSLWPRPATAHSVAATQVQSDGPPEPEVNTFHIIIR